MVEIHVLIYTDLATKVLMFNLREVQLWLDKRLLNK